MDREGRKRLIEELFGSDDEGEEEPSKVTASYSEILPGLKLFHHFLNVNSADNINDVEEHDNQNNKKTKREETAEDTGKENNSEMLSANDILKDIMSQYPFTRDLNQVMSFGELPSFISPVLELLETTPNLFPGDIMEREPLFDQMICNYYEPGQGITPHVDLLTKFDDGIVIISLGSSCIMDFRPVTNIEEDEKYSEKKEIKNNEGSKISVLLQPGDVLSICGDARYKWTHGIEKHLVDEWEGKSIPRGKRVSVTLRRLLQPPPT